MAVLTRENVCRYCGQRLPKGVPAKDINATDLPHPWRPARRRPMAHESARLFMRGENLTTAERSAFVKAGDYYRYWHSVIAYQLASEVV